MMHDDEREFNSGDEYEVQPVADVDLTGLAVREQAFEETMKRRGLAIVRMVSDGSCLFRAVSHAVYGDAEMHDQVRALCMDYLSKERDFFSRYVTEDFDAYLARKRRLDVHGNHLEMHALSEMYSRPIHVYCYSETPMNTFQPDGVSAQAPAIHLSYHNNNHFNALVDLDAPSVGVGLGLPAYEPTADRNEAMKHATDASEQEAIDADLLRAGAHQSEMLEIEAEMERAAMEESAAVGRGCAASGNGALGSLPPVVAELVAMGHDEDQVIQALTIFGDDHASLLCYLTTNEESR